MAKKQENTIEKPPVVVVLGHVDHGKSTLLEAIRSEIRITGGESGGITQHVGAYEVEKDGKTITFIDTPGHEAFSAMRMRGATVADIAVLVVDATESVKEQTKEAINFAKKAGIPMVVAINKMDREGAQPAKVIKELEKNQVKVESLGGDVPAVEVSAKEKTGIDDLLENILILAEVEELKVNSEGMAEGTIIESELNPKQGPLATLIIQEGTLKQSDVLGTSSTTGKVKRMNDFQGESIKEAGPSKPVQVLGFENTPKIGEKFKAFKSQQEAEEILKQEDNNSSRVISTGKGEEILNIILKADVLGTLEAIETTLKNIPQEEVTLRIVDSGVGNVDSSDIQLAESSKARVFGFRVSMDKNASFFAEQKNIRPMFFEVIYELVEEVRKEMERKLSPDIKKIKSAELKVLRIFQQKKDTQVIGGRITSGTVLPGTDILVFRDKERVGRGRVKSIQEEKQNIGKASKGQEIGMLVTGAPEIREDDRIVFYQRREKKRSLA